MTENEQPTSNRRRKRGSRGPGSGRTRQTCRRDGCTYRAHGGHEHCSFVCHVIAEELAKAQRMCEAVGPGTLTAELWSSVVAMSDTWTEVLRVHTDLFNVAKSSGITSEQWDAIKKGQPE